jgi:hypothetical protein
MIDLSPVYRQDDILFGVIQEIQPDVALDCFKKNGLPQTGLAMTTFAAKSGFLKTAIFDLCEADNLYGTNIIFRSLIEHILKAQYIFMKWVEDQTDQVGFDYWEWYEASEVYDHIKSWEAVSILFNNGKKSEKPEKILHELRPSFAGKPIKEIKAVSAQFNYRNIIEYINNELKKGSKSGSFLFLENIIPSYSELSGFVHGGPSSDKLSMFFADEEKRHQELFHRAELSVALVGSVVRWLTLMLVNFDKSFQEHFDKLNKAL